MSRPFPWKCRNCLKKSVRPKEVDYTTEIEHDGRTYRVNVPNLTVHECEECHAQILPDASFARVMDVFRHEAGLLSPFEIRQNRERYRLTQKELALAIGVAEGTLSRWETGAQIQQRSLDKFLRVFFSFQEVRDALLGRGSTTINLPQNAIPFGFYGGGKSMVTQMIWCKLAGAYDPEEATTRASMAPDPIR